MRHSSRSWALVLAGLLASPVSFSHWDAQSGDDKNRQHHYRWQFGACQVAGDDPFDTAASYMSTCRSSLIVCDVAVETHPTSARETWRVRAKTPGAPDCEPGTFGVSLDWAVDNELHCAHGYEAGTDGSCAPSGGQCAGFVGQSESWIAQSAPEGFNVPLNTDPTWQVYAGCAFDKSASSANGGCFNVTYVATGDLEIDEDGWGDLHDLGDAYSSLIPYACNPSTGEVSDTFGQTAQCEFLAGRERSVTYTLANDTEPFLDEMCIRSCNAGSIDVAVCVDKDGTGPGLEQSCSAKFRWYDQSSPKFGLCESGGIPGQGTPDAEVGSATEEAILDELERQTGILEDIRDNTEAGSGDGSTVIGSGSCDAEPICTGSEVQCEILLESHRTRCSPTFSDSEAQAATGAGSADGSELGSTFAISGLDSTGWWSDRSCISDLSIDLGGSFGTVSVPLSALCGMFQVLGALVLAIAYFVGGRIVIGGI